jgi:hypothetical protein
MVLEIISDSRTVWINDDSGCCVGRFSKFGVDVHRTGDEQAAGAPQCLDCVHEGTPLALWEHFRESMLLHYGVFVRPELAPSFVQTKTE